MEHKRISIFVSAFLLCLLSACQLTGVTPQPPGAGIIQNNPGGLIQAPPTSTTPTAAPTASSGCNQLGCPYPAVCDKTSGVCTINQAQGPGAAAPQAPGAGIIANNPGANSLVPACPPPPLTISKITSFCANPSANQGGANVVWSDNPVTPQAFSSYYLIEDGYQTGGNGKEDDWNSNQTVFSGPQGTNVVMTYCSVCSTVPNLVTWNGYQQYLGTTGNDQVLPGFGDPSACPTGYYGPQCNTLYNYQNGYTDSPGDAPLFPCASGTHYDNGKQNCVDDVTGKIASPCPPGYPYLFAGISGHYPAQCYKNPFPISYNCLSYTIPLGECTTPSKKNPKCTINPITGAQTCR